MAAPMEESQGKYYVQLSKKPVKFDSVSRFNNVFFDETNKQVFCVQIKNNQMHVIAKGPDEKKKNEFHMDSKGDVLSIKFSKDYNVLGVQRSPKSVEFINFHEGCDVLEYSQSCKGKTTRILGFCWVDQSEIIFITDHGLEYYQVIPDKRTLKSIKTHAANVNWFVWLPAYSMLLLSSGPLGNTIYPFLFKQSSMIKIPKFEVELLHIPKPMKLCLPERDVIMANIYHQLYVLIIRHNVNRDESGTSSAEIVLYLLHKDMAAKKTDVLKLDIGGRFAVNIIDNIVAVHHQVKKVSYLFDIKLRGRIENGVNYHLPFITPRPLNPFKINIPATSVSVNISGQPQEVEVNYELYSSNWIIFQPNIVIDARLGYMWFVHLYLEPLVTMFPNKRLLIDFLLLRKECKFVVLNVCKDMLSPGHQADLTTIAKVFDKLNHVYASYLQSEMMAQATDSPQKAPNQMRTRNTIIDQSDMYTHVFTCFVDNKDINYKFKIAVLVEYIRSLSQNHIPVQHYLYELVINTLVHNKAFYQLHQFLQYHVLSDSKPLACLLLSLESCYPPAYQLALDMLKRLSTANEEIIEVLLSKQQLLTALRFVRSIGAVDNVSARKFLDAARSMGDTMIFYTVFKFFEQRNIRLRNDPSFPKGEHCEKFVKHFESVFGPETINISTKSTS